MAQALVETCGAEVRFVGSDHGIERTAVPRAGFAVDLLPIRGVLGQGWRGLLRAASVVPRSLFAAWGLVGRYGRDLVIGVGGYAAFPALAVAVLRRRPVVLLEQNAAPGLVTRLFAPFAHTICVSFPETEQVLGPRARLTGNPIRWDASPSEPDASSAGASSQPLRVLVFGGSAGAHRLNENVPDAIARVGEGVTVVHQTGAREREDVAQRYETLGVAAEVTAFIDDMEAAYRNCDLAICRAGATTLAELTALGVPAILVPYPFAVADHQRVNAQAVVDAGAAWMILDQDLEPVRLARLLEEARSDRAALARRGTCARALGRPDALRDVVARCREAAGVGGASR